MSADTEAFYPCRQASSGIKIDPALVAWDKTSTAYGY
jgi:hypothetical protein